MCSTSVKWVCAHLYLSVFSSWNMIFIFLCLLTMVPFYLIFQKSEYYVMYYNFLQCYLGVSLTDFLRFVY